MEYKWWETNVRSCWLSFRLLLFPHYPDMPLCSHTLSPCSYCVCVCIQYILAWTKFTIVSVLKIMTLSACSKYKECIVEIAYEQFLDSKNLLACCLINLTLQSLLLLACCFKLLHIQQDKGKALKYCTVHVSFICTYSLGTYTSKEM